MVDGSAGPSKEKKENKPDRESKWAISWNMLKFILEKPYMLLTDGVTKSEQGLPKSFNK